MLLLSSLSGPDPSTKEKKPSGVKWVDTTEPNKKTAIATVITDKPLEAVVVHKIISKDSLKPIMNKDIEIFTSDFQIPQNYLDMNVYEIPEERKNIKREEINNKVYTKKGISPFKKSNGKNERQTNLEQEIKNEPDIYKKMHADLFPDIFGGSNIIIQNPQKVEFNTFISPPTVETKKINKKVFYSI